MNKGPHKKGGSKTKGLVYQALSFLAGSPILGEKKTEQDFDETLYSRFPIIPFFAHANEFPVFLSLLAEVVPEHSGAIKAKTRWATNGPLNVTRSNPCTIINRTTAEAVEIPDAELDAVESFLCNINVQGENIQEVLKKAIKDVETTGNGYIELIRGSVAGTPFFFVEHHDATTGLLIRREQGNTIGFAADWNQIDNMFRVKTEDVNELPIYRGKRTNWLENDGVERCVIHLKQYSTGRFWYGLPESVASVMSQKIGFEINRHNIDRLETDFFPRLFFEFFNTDGMSEEQQQEHLEAFIGTYTKASDERFGIFANYNETNETQTKIHTLETTVKGAFLEMKREMRQDILTAHNIHPCILGIQTTGSLGSGKEVREIWSMFNNVVIEPLQSFLEQNMLAPIMEEAGAWLGEFDGLYVEMTSSMPVSFMGDINPSQVLTINEGRAILGVGDLKNEDGTDDSRGDKLIEDKETKEAEA